MLLASIPFNNFGVVSGFFLLDTCTSGLIKSWGFGLGLEVYPRIELLVYLELKIFTIIGIRLLPFFHYRTLVEFVEVFNWCRMFFNVEIRFVTLIGLDGRIWIVMVFSDQFIAFFTLKPSLLHTIILENNEWSWLRHLRIVWAKLSLIQDFGIQALRGLFGEHSYLVGPHAFVHIIILLKLLNSRLGFRSGSHLEWG